jgi:N-acyl homoserine lactone hydrolase
MQAGPCGMHWTLRQETPVPSGTPNPAGVYALSELRLYLVPVGVCDLHESVLTPERFQDRRLRVPIWSYLIRTGDTNILIDTGMPPAAADGPLFPNDRIVPVMTREEVITARLAGLGLQPRDVDVLINSHLHFDHAGGNTLFPDHTFVLQRAEYALVESGRYDAPYCQVMKKVKLLDGDAEIVPGVQAIFTPGHAPGHMSFLVRTSRPILLTVDASYTADTFAPDRLGAMQDKEAGASSVLRLQEIARSEGAAIFFGHDLRQGEEWRKAPEYYA